MNLPSNSTGGGERASPSEIEAEYGSGGYGQDTSFELSGGGAFAPYYQPENFRYSKERELNRQPNFCDGEDVTDNGSKNIEVHLSGYMLSTELPAFSSIYNSDKAMMMVSPGWSGEVRVSEVEWEGQFGFDPFTKKHLWKYTIDLVSTGDDERTSSWIQNGIISGGGDSGGSRSQAAVSATGGGGNI